MKTFEDNSLTIGETPLVHLNRIAPGKKIFAKLKAATLLAQLNAASGQT